MEHYVTLFDSLFLPQGLALHMSMERHAGEYTLWILCVDDDVHVALSQLNLPNVQLLLLSKLETPELLKIKSTRTKGEYCWTLTPFAPRFVFEENSKIPRVTYIDADVWFRKNPKPIFEEFQSSGKQVLITDHAYAPEYDKSATSGQYCVQFMTFTRSGGEVVRKWWEERCIEWCFARFEDGKFGDQKYLDDWPVRFENLVHVLLRQEWTLAPWNAIRFPFGQGIFYHFHGLRITNGHGFDFGGSYFLPRALIVNIYEPYTIDIKHSIETLEKYGITINAQAKKITRFILFKRFLKGSYHQLKKLNFLNYKN